MKPNGTVHLSDIPELAREWDFEKNISDLTPDKITVGSNRIVWWRCAKGHSWKDAVVKRTHGKPCPYCTNRRVLIGYNDLATLYPKLANEWDYSNNVGVDINTVVPGYSGLRSADFGSGHEQRRYGRRSLRHLPAEQERKSPSGLPWRDSDLLPVRR